MDVTFVPQASVAPIIAIRKQFSSYDMSVITQHNTSKGRVLYCITAVFKSMEHFPKIAWVGGVSGTPIGRNAEPYLSLTFFFEMFWK